MFQKSISHVQWEYKVASECACMFFSHLLQSHIADIGQNKTIKSMPNFCFLWILLFVDWTGWLLYSYFILWLLSRKKCIGSKCGIYCMTLVCYQSARQQYRNCGADCRHQVTPGALMNPHLVFALRFSLQDDLEQWLGDEEYLYSCRGRRFSAHHLCQQLMNLHILLQL